MQKIKTLVSCEAVIIETCHVNTSEMLMLLKLYFVPESDKTPPSIVNQGEAFNYNSLCKYYLHPF